MSQNFCAEATRAHVNATEVLIMKQKVERWNSANADEGGTVVLWANLEMYVSRFGPGEERPDRSVWVVSSAGTVLIKHHTNGRDNWCCQVNLVSLWCRYGDKTLGFPRLWALKLISIVVHHLWIQWLEMESETGWKYFAVILSCCVLAFEPVQLLVIVPPDFWFSSFKVERTSQWKSDWSILTPPPLPASQDPPRK